MENARNSLKKAASPSFKRSLPITRGSMRWGIAGQSANLPITCSPTMVRRHFSHPPQWPLLDGLSQARKYFIANLLSAISRSLSTRRASVPSCKNWSDSVDHSGSKIGCDPHGCSWGYEQVEAIIHFEIDPSRHNATLARAAP
jgi:hypothetical protein